MPRRRQRLPKLHGQSQPLQTQTEKTQHHPLPTQHPRTSHQSIQGSAKVKTQQALNPIQIITLRTQAQKRREPPQKFVIDRAPAVKKPKNKRPKTQNKRLRISNKALLIKSSSPPISNQLDRTPPIPHESPKTNRTHPLLLPTTTQNLRNQSKSNDRTHRQIQNHRKIISTVSKRHRKKNRTTHTVKLTTQTNREQLEGLWWRNRSNQKRIAEIVSTTEPRQKQPQPVRRELNQRT